MLGLEKRDLIAAVVVTHDSRKGWISRLVVAPDHRRQGHAARLIAAAESILREAGILVIAALVEDGNRASLALFQKMGVRRRGREYSLPEQERER